MNRKGPLLVADNVKACVSQMTKGKLHDLDYGTFSHTAHSANLESNWFRYVSVPDQLSKG